MREKKYPTPLAAIAVTGAALLVGGCNHNDDDDNMQEMPASYTVTVHNLTNNQPLAPVAAILHSAGYRAWTPGSAASDGLEQLAEGGDTTAFLAAADANPVVAASAASTGGPFAPGASVSVTLQGSHSADLQLSVAAMLVNTNDAYTGVTGRVIGGLSTGESISFMTPAYDAGTELNSEAIGTIPGPADTTAGGGEGYNAARDDGGDFVSIHAGVVTQDDGLVSSVLDESHRWTGPVAKVTVTRVN